MTDLAVRSGSTLTIAIDQPYWTDRQLAALYQLGLANTPPADLEVFFHQCQRTGLDPFARQIHMIGRNTQNPRTNQWETKYTIQVGIDGFRLIGRRAATANNETLEVTDTQWCGSDGRWRDVWLEDSPPAAARVAVVRNGGRFPAVALFSEYAQKTRAGAVNRIWLERPAGQLEKCAEALAWRRAFPQDLSGLYTTDELGAEVHAPQTETPQEAQLDGITKPQLAKLHILINEHQLGREEGLAFYESVIGRPASSSKQLSKAEASQIIDALTEAQAEGVQPVTGEVVEADLVAPQYTEPTESA